MTLRVEHLKFWPILHTSFAKGPSISYVTRSSIWNSDPLLHTRSVHKSCCAYSRIWNSAPSSMEFCTLYTQDSRRGIDVTLGPDTPPSSKKCSRRTSLPSKNSSMTASCALHSVNDEPMTKFWEFCQRHASVNNETTENKNIKTRQNKKT